MHMCHNQYMDTKQVGSSAEATVADFLKRKRYKILGTNLDFGFGEIDILARHKSDIVVVEVKAKSTREFGAGYEMVNFYKQKKLLSLAKNLQKKYPRATIRIDVVSVDLSQSPPAILHFENAVEEN